MKTAIVTLLSIVIGYGAQRWLRPTVADVELEATAAWNSGDAASAERLARNALARDPESDQACRILEQVAFHSGRPELQVAIAAVQSKKALSEGDRLAEIGNVAMSQNLLRVAQHYWSEGLLVEPANLRLHHGMVTLAALQLSPDRMGERLLEWCEYGTPPEESVLLFLGSAAVEGRDAATTEATLRSCLEADSADIETRYSLAKCLIAQGRHRECELILKDAAGDPVQATLLALSHAVAGDSDAAFGLLPGTAPEESLADYHYAFGLIAFQQDRWSDAVFAFARAVELRPLSRTFRTRYCEALRRSGDATTAASQVKLQKTVFRIVDIAKNTDTELDQQTTQRLLTMCDSVGASEAARIVRQYRIR